MKVFISWSGEQSKALAEILRQWLPSVIQFVKPYFSPDDIAKGTRWSSEIAKELDGSKIGLICLTRDNTQAPWIMFEAGALSKNLDKSKVCPILFGLEPSDIQGPLVHFQASKFEKLEIKKVVKMINNEAGEQALEPNILDSVFEKWWPELKQSVEEELAGNQLSDQADIRSERELLEEVLELTRSISQRANRSQIDDSVAEDLVRAYLELVDQIEKAGVLRRLRAAVISMTDLISILSKQFAITPGTRVMLRSIESQFGIVRKEDIDEPPMNDDDIPF